jgi:hypothetical protein
MSQQRNTYNIGLMKLAAHPKGAAAAQADAWPKTIAFFEAHVGGVKCQCQSLTQQTINAPAVSPKSSFRWAKFIG